MIENNLIVINDLILAELLPYLKIQNQGELIKLLQTVERVPLTINWSEIVEMQFQCIRRGVNKVGIPDLLIAQNSMQNQLQLFSSDKHFSLMAEVLELKLF